MFVFLYRARGGISTDDLSRAYAAIDSSSIRQQWISPDGKLGLVWLDGTLFTQQGDGKPAIDRPFVFAQGRLDAPEEVRRHMGVPSNVSHAQLIASCVLSVGENSPNLLPGDFAIAHWTGKALFIATDHIGQETLYYTNTTGGFAVATRLPLLLALPDTPRSLNTTRLALLVTGRMGRHTGETAYTGIRLLPGGSSLWLSEGREIKMRRWWKPDSTIRRAYRDPRDYTEELRELFDAAVRCRLPTDGPVGCMLSGGLDSTLVAGFAAPILKEGNQTLHAWTSVPHPKLKTQPWPGWDDNDWDYAVQMGKQHSNILHHAVSPEGICLLDVFHSIHANSATPVRNSANHLWMTEIALRAKQMGCKTVLHGVRGNAGISFAGEGGIARLLRYGKWARAAEHVRRVPGHRHRRWIPHLVSAFAGESTWQAIMRIAGKSPAVIPGEPLLQRNLRTMYLQGEPDLSPINKRQDWVEFISWPRSSFAINFKDYAGVNEIDPSGDRRLFEYLLSCPPEAFVGSGFDRLQARLLGAGRVPDSIRWRRTRGAQAPEAAGFFTLHPERYRAAWDEVRRLSWTKEYIDIQYADRLLDKLIAGHMQPVFDSMAFYRIFDIGLFIVYAGRQPSG